MNIIIDTSVWSLALRRQRSSPSAETREPGKQVSDGTLQTVYGAKGANAIPDPIRANADRLRRDRS
jgi:hypothetical protein